MAHVSAIFLPPVFEKSVIFNNFRAIALRISAREGGYTVCWKAMARQRTVDNSMTYWFPWKHPMARRRGLEFGVFDHDQTPRNGLVGSALLASPLDPFPRQNYHNQSIGSALRASPFVAFGAFALKYYPNVDSALRASPFKRCKCSSPQFFRRFDVRLAVSDMLRSTPTTPIVIVFLCYIL